MPPPVSSVTTPLTCCSAAPMSVVAGSTLIVIATLPWSSVEIVTSSA